MTDRGEWVRGEWGGDEWRRGGSGRGGTGGALLARRTTARDRSGRAYRRGPDAGLDEPGGPRPYTRDGRDVVLEPRPPGVMAQRRDVRVYSAGHRHPHRLRRRRRRCPGRAG